MNQQDRDFVRTALAVLIGLVLLAVIFFFAAQLLSTMSGGGPATLSMAQKATEERIQPVGQVETGTGAPAGGEAAGGGRSGKEVVAAVCGACHSTGAAGAPKIGDKAAWAPRADQGMEAMMQSAINGKGAMPPRGGGQVSDEELKKAIVHMLQETGIEVAGAGAGGEQAAAGAEQKEAGKDDGGKAASGEANLERGKEVVQKTCAACHTAGVAGAPKIGDKQAWEARVEQGMDVMLKAVVNGKGAMPPKGGGNHSEEELSDAIHYMLKESGF